MSQPAQSIVRVLAECSDDGRLTVAQIANELHHRIADIQHVLVTSGKFRNELVNGVRYWMRAKSA